MTSLLSQNNTGGSVDVVPLTFKALRLLASRYLHMLWSGSTTTHEDQMHDEIASAGDERKSNGNCSEIISVPQGSETFSGIRSQQDSVIDASQVEAAFHRARLPVAAALVESTDHCPSQFGRKMKKNRQYGSLKQENSHKIAEERHQLTGLGRPRQEDDVLFSWLTHAFVPSDMHSDAHTQREAAHKILFASIQQGRWSYWITRPLRTTRTSASDGLAQGDLQSPTSHSQTPPIPAARFSSAYASCFANPQRKPSVIRWKQL